MANPVERAYLDSLHPHPDFPPIHVGPPSQQTNQSAYSNSAGNMSIQAQSDEIKYQGKYKELKRKVKEIELDNDKLQVKVMKVKKQIERLRLERAILYERLMVIATPAPNATAAGVPSGIQAGSGPQPSTVVPENFYTVVGQNHQNPMTPAVATVVTAQYQQKAQPTQGPGPAVAGPSGGSGGGSGFGAESYARMPQSNERERVERDQDTRYYRDGVHGHRSEGHGHGGSGSRGVDHLPPPPNLR